jgi:SPP1 gp7 family putative phage head morphogenesis protein
MWAATAEHQRFDESADWLLARTVVDEGTRREIPADARARAFWVAGAAQLDVVNDVFTELRAASDQGLGFEEFRKQVRPKLLKAWGGVEPPHRIRLIYRNATTAALNAGRYQQMRDPEVMARRPYWLFDAVRPTPCPSEICTELDGKIFRADDPRVDVVYPPNHHGCQSGFRCIRASEAERRGGVSQEPIKAEAQEGFGLSPALSRPWMPDGNGRDADLIGQLGAKVEAEAQAPDPLADALLREQRAQRLKEQAAAIEREQEAARAALVARKAAKAAQAAAEAEAQRAATAAREAEEQAAREVAAEEARRAEEAKLTEERAAAEAAAKAESERLAAEKAARDSAKRAEAEEAAARAKADLMRRARMESHPVEPAPLPRPKPTTKAEIKIDRIVPDLLDDPINEAAVRHKAIALRKSTPITDESVVAERERGYWGLSRAQVDEVQTYRREARVAFKESGAFDDSAIQAVFNFSNGSDATIRDISSGKYSFQQIVKRRNAAMNRAGKAETMEYSMEHCRDAMQYATDLERAFWASPDGAIADSYRGISDLSTETLHRFLGHDEVDLQGKPSSSSAMYSIAKGFAEPSITAKEPHLGHSVVFKFSKRKTKAVPMCAVSDFEQEVELLMHGNTKWKVVRRTRTNHQAGRQLADGEFEENWIMELEELD